MKKLTDEEKNWLLCYCMESEENTRLALEIGQIQSELEKAIIQSFLKTFQKKLDEKIRGKLGDSWEQEVPEGDVDWSQDNKIYVIRKDTIEIGLFYQPKHENRLYIGLPVEPEVGQVANRLEKDFLAPVFKDKGLKLQRESGWHWWFFPRDDHQMLGDLGKLHHDKEVRTEKIECFTDLLAFTAKVISGELEK